MEGLRPETMKQYIAGMTKRREKTWNVLTKDHGILKLFFETDMGQELFGWLQDKHEELLSKIASIKASDEEKIEYKLVHDWLLDWATKYHSYTERLRIIEDSVEKENLRRSMI